MNIKFNKWNSKWNTLVLVNVLFLGLVAFWLHSTWPPPNRVIFVEVGEVFTPQVSTRRVMRSAQNAVADAWFGENSRAMKPFLLNEPIFIVSIVENDDDSELKAIVYISAVSGEVLSIHHIASTPFRSVDVKSS